MRLWSLRGLLVAACLTLTAAIPADKQNLLDQPHLPTEFNADQWRAMYLELTNAPLPNPTTVLNLPAEGTPKRALIDFFNNKIEPKLDQLSQLEHRYYGYYLLVDSGLYQSEEEKKSWSTKMNELLAIFSEHETDEAWQATVSEFGRLAKGLTGTLPELAIAMAKTQELNAYPSRYMAQYTELNQLDQQIGEIAAQLPGKDRSLEVEAETAKVENDYFNGKLAYADAAAQLERLAKEGAPLIGKQLIEQAGDKLQRTAVLRTQLAQAKGFKNWAALQVARQAEAHSEGFRTSGEMLDFLYQLLDATEVPARRFYRIAAAKQNRPVESLRPVDLALLMRPADSYLYGFFPKEKIESIWRESVADSGYSPDVSRRVLIDAFPRKNKQGHAYMMPARKASIINPEIDGATLNFIIPPPNSPLWSKSLTVIVQNFTDSNVSDVRTMDHEGDHGLDFASQRPEPNDFDAYGKSETYSMAREKRAQDREFLQHYAVNAEGVRATPEAIQTYLDEAKLEDLLHFRGTLFGAIFDIELWNYDYSKPGAAKIWERAIYLNKGLREKLRGFPVHKDLIVANGHAMFSTGHYYSGSVRYSGYALASVSAQMINDFLLDYFEKNTGRRSLFKQPQTAELMTKAFLETPKTRFPESIERFTGKPFAATEFARNLNREAMLVLDKAEAELGNDCDRNITNPGRKSADVAAPKGE